MPAPAKPQDPIAQLAMAPLRNAKARILRDEPERLVIELDSTYAPWLGPLPRLLGAKKSRRYELDGLALALWRRIDDRRTLEELIDHLAAEEQLTFNEARILALQWLRSLAVKGLVVLGERAADPAAGG